MIRAALAYYLRRLDLIGAIIAVWRVRRFERQLVKWDRRAQESGLNIRMRAVERNLGAGGGVVYEVRDGRLHKVRR